MHDPLPLAIRIFICSILLIFFSSCASTTIIHTSPEGAKVFINGKEKGVTPYRHKDRKAAGSQTSIQLVKEGYEPSVTEIRRTGAIKPGAVIGGLFSFGIGWIWCLDYPPNYEFSLIRETILEEGDPGFEEQVRSRKKSKVERLIELKALFDQGILTQEEFDQEKKKILAEKDE